MLSLNRRVGESVSLYGVIGGHLVELAVIVTEIRQGQVKLGFAAPDWLEIEREEIAQPTRMLASVRESYNIRRAAGASGVYRKSAPCRSLAP
jgi:carbon storage regulator CsrA